MISPDKKQPYRWQVQWLKLASLKENPDNPRIHGEKDLAALQESIRKYGPIWPILVNNFQELLMVAGHGRKAAAIAEGYDDWPVIDAAHLSPVEIDEFMTVDNRVQEMSLWDEKKLAEGFARRGGKEIPGFLVGDIQKLEAKRWDEHDEKPEVIPPVPEKATCTVGELYILGRHRLLVGDCTTMGTWKRLMGDQRASICFTDPPWHVNYGVNLAEKAKSRPIMNDNLNDAEWDKFLQEFTATLSAFMRPGALIYCVMGSQEWPSIHGALAKSGFHWSSTIIWAKDSAVMARKDYHTQYEPIWYGWLDGAPRLVELKDRKQSDVWNISRPKRSEAKITPLQNPKSSSPGRCGIRRSKGILSLIPSSDRGPL